MKILYIADIDTIVNKADGVQNKIHSQCKALRDLGHDCRLLSLRDRERQEGRLRKINRKLREIFLPIPKALCARVVDFAPDIIYVRHLPQLFSPRVSFFEQVKNGARVIWEMPTYPYTAELWNSIRNRQGAPGSLLALMFEFRSIERLRKVVDEFVVVNEIDDVKARERLGKYRVIPNGFDVSSVPVRTPPELDDEIHILALANLAYWHGFDRIIAGMARYSGQYKVVLHLAGGNGKSEMEKLKKQAEQLGVADRIVFYPPLHGDSLTAVFDKCHVAAGSLGMHRSDYFRASTLKLREYCARGIPFFTSCVDDAFENFEYCQSDFPANDEPIDIEKLCNFTERVYKTSHHEVAMREYAQKNLDWSVQMAKLF